MTDETKKDEKPAAENGDKNRPTYVAKQYRVVRVDDGWKTRKERIGVAFQNDNGSICFRPSGVQLIEGDVHFFPIEEDNA